jgi:glycosyltransferase involved in cell wall biosynthesis
LKKIVIAYNTSHYIYAFKLNLIKSLQSEGCKVIAVAPYDNYSEKFKDIGVEYREVKMDNKGSNPIKDFFIILQLIKIFYDLKPNMVFNFTIKPNIYSTIAASLLKIPVVNNITGLGTVFINGGISLKIVKILYKFAFLFPKRIFFQNKDDMELFLTHKLVKKDKLYLLPGSGVDLKKYQPIKKSKNLDKFIFLLIGRMIKDKGIEEFIEAAKQIRNKYLDVEFHLLGGVGVANKSAISIETLKSYEDLGVIKYLGETKDIRPFIGNSDVVVLPSYREGMPRTLLEASAMSKPTIGTNVPGCKDAIDDKINGLLCEVKNVTDLANKMKYILDLTEEERNKMGINGRIKMENEFDEKIVLEAYLKELIC